MDIISFFLKATFSNCYTSAKIDENSISDYINDFFNIWLDDWEDNESYKDSNYYLLKYYCQNLVIYPNLEILKYYNNYVLLKSNYYILKCSVIDKYTIECENLFYNIKETAVIDKNDILRKINE